MVIEHTIKTQAGLIIAKGTDACREWVRHYACGDWQYANDYGRKVCTRAIHACLDADGYLAGTPVGWERKVLAASRQ